MALPDKESRGGTTPQSYPAPGAPGALPREADRAPGTLAPPEWLQYAGVPNPSAFVFCPYRPVGPANHPQSEKRPRPDQGGSRSTLIHIRLPAGRRACGEGTGPISFALCTRLLGSSHYLMGFCRFEEPLPLCRLLVLRV